MFRSANRTEAPIAQPIGLPAFEAGDEPIRDLEDQDLEHERDDDEAQDAERRNHRQQHWPDQRVQEREQHDDGDRGQRVAIMVPAGGGHAVTASETAPTRRR